MKILKTAKTISLIGLTSYLTYKSISELLFKKAFNRNPLNEEIDDIYLNWFDNSKHTNVNINSYDGFSLNGCLIENNDTNNYIVLVHGIMQDSKSMYKYAFEFDKFGYNCLLIDQRASGLSQGLCYTFGLKESQDLVRWVNYLVSYKTNIQICLFGVSMGAATCMMALDYNLKENVKCIIEDSGYASLKDELIHLIQYKFKIFRPSIILKLFEEKMYSNFGFKFNDICPKKCLNTNKIPILLIHGSRDRVVPFETLKILYNNNLGEKKYYEVKGKDHLETLTSENYFKNINDFVLKYFD